MQLGIFRRAALLATLACAACGPAQVIVLSDAVVRESPPASLEVIACTTAVRDPLPLAGERTVPTVITGLDRELQRAVLDGTADWVARHLTDSPRQLIVEVARAEASRASGRVTVALDVRATLRTHEGRFYLAQTQMHCRQAAVADAKGAAAVFFACTASLGHDLGGWLSGIAP